MTGSLLRVFSRRLVTRHARHAGAATAEQGFFYPLSRLQDEASISISCPRHPRLAPVRCLCDQTSANKTSTSSWDVGNPPSESADMGGGGSSSNDNDNNNNNLPSEDRGRPTIDNTSLHKETSTRQMIHAKAKETEHRLSEEAGMSDGRPRLNHDSSPNNMMQEGEGQSVWALGMKVTIRCPGERTNGLYTLLEYALVPGDGSQTHTHSREDETWYMLDGEMEWKLKDKAFQAKKGCFMHLPSGVPHSFHNNSRQPARMLVSCLPSGLEKYFLEIGIPVASDTKRPSFSQEDARRAIDAGMKYGVSFSRPEEKLAA